MIELAMFLVVLAVCSMTSQVFALFRAGRRRSAAGRLRDELFVADRRIESEFHRARRAMNEAAGQDWRNLAG